MGLPSRGHANEKARDDLLGPAPGLGLAFAPWLATPLHLLVRQLVRFVRLIIDPLRQVITSSRVSSRIRAQGLSHHADRARGNLAAKRPGEPRRWQLPTPPRLSTHDDLHDVSRGRGTRHSHWPCALRLARWATAPDREMRVYATKSGLDAPVYRASVPVRRHTRPTAWLPRTKPKPKPVQLFRKYTLVTHKHAANRAGGRLHPDAPGPGPDRTSRARCRAKPPVMR